jgi:low affinity Fe/Cu permease
MVSRGSRIALYLGAALVVVYLVAATTGGVMAFVVYWVAALVLVLQALPITSRPRVRGTA